MDNEERSYKKILFIPGFLRNYETVGRILGILWLIQPIFKKAGWEIVLSQYYQNKPTTLPLKNYAEMVRQEIINGGWDAIIVHSMGGLLLPENIPGNIPVIVIESPWHGVLKWQFRVINLLVRFKGEKGFPLDNLSVQGMLRNSEYMQSRNLSPAWASRALQINGWLGTCFLARIGNTFGKIPEVLDWNYTEYPNLDHVGILMDPNVIAEVLRFLDRKTRQPSPEK